MEPASAIERWFTRNWPLAMTCAVLMIGAAVLLMRSTEYKRPSTAEAASVEPVSAVMVPGEATVIRPGGNGAPQLVSDVSGNNP